MVVKQITLQNGLYARQAVSFVQRANHFDSEIKIKKENNIEANAKSILGLLPLVLTQGVKITIEASGCDEKKAIEEREFYSRSKIKQ